MMQAVFNGSKILIWKQITTKIIKHSMIYCCFQWFKDTNLKANHNKKYIRKDGAKAVFNGSKILIWKQITTYKNGQIMVQRLFSMVQRY